MSKPKFPNFF
uniref:Uncharacterized protein n=1 Tax=Rhizophora mucronata TaxID=61149 RepID=A0A2P2R2U5_RHIMU